MTIEELCYVLDDEKIDVLEFLKNVNLCESDRTGPEQMGARELLMYNSKLLKEMKKYNTIRKWRKILGHNLKYRKPFLANPEALLTGNRFEDLKLLDEIFPEYLDDSELSDDDPSDYDDDSDNDDEEMKSIDYFRTESTTEETREAIANMSSKKMKKLKRRINKQLYVVPCFMIPGKHNFVV